VRLEIDSLPLATSEYFGVVDHNLRLRENENSWEKKITAPLLVAATFVFLWKFDRVSDPMAMLPAVAIAIPAIVYAAYSVFVSTPRKLENERATLDGLRAEGERD
jgi:hypothetical protein